MAARRRREPSEISSEHNGIYMLPSLEGLDEKKEKGRGSYGAVYEVKLNGLPCIAKGIHNILLDSQVSSGEQEIIRGKFFEECLLLSSLRHPNIVQFLGVHQREENTYLVMEYMHMPLDQCLEEYPDIPLPFKTSIAQDVSYGLLHLHSLHPPIIHRDLSATNILLTEGMRAKIADLGVSKAFDLQWLHKISGQTIQPGTLAYMPPEALTKKPVYDLKLDIFSFGALLLYIATQQFPNVYEPSVNDKIREAIETQTIQILKRKCWIEQMGETHPFHSIVIQCLQDSPQARPTTLALNEAICQLHSKQTKEWKNILELQLYLMNSTSELQQLHLEHQKVTNEAASFKSQTQKALQQHKKQLNSCRAELKKCQTEMKKYKAHSIAERGELQREAPKDSSVDSSQNMEKKLLDRTNSWKQREFLLRTEWHNLKAKDPTHKPVPAPRIRQSDNTTSRSKQPSVAQQSGPRLLHRAQSPPAVITTRQREETEVNATPHIPPEDHSKYTHSSSTLPRSSSQLIKKHAGSVPVLHDPMQQKRKDEDIETGQGCSVKDRIRMFESKTDQPAALH